MTLSASTNKLQYSGDDTTASFSISFVIWDEDDVEVILTSGGVDTTWTRGTQYTISLTNPPATATLSVVTTPTDYTPATGDTLTIRSNLANTQPTSLPAGGALPSSTVEKMVDQVARQVQQLAEEVDRALKFQKSSTMVDITVSEPSAGKILRWNSGETGLENVDAGTSATTPLGLADGGTGATTAAGARTNLGINLAAQQISLWRLGQF